MTLTTCGMGCKSCTASIKAVHQGTPARELRPLAGQMRNQPGGTATALASCLRCRPDSTSCFKLILPVGGTLENTDLTFIKLIHE